MSQTISKQVQEFYENWIDWSGDWGDWNIWEEAMLLRHDIDSDMPHHADAVLEIVEET